MRVYDDGPVAAAGDVFHRWLSGSRAVKLVSTANPPSSTFFDPGSSTRLRGHMERGDLSSLVSAPATWSALHGAEGWVVLGMLHEDGSDFCLLRISVSEPGRDSPSWPSTLLAPDALPLLFGFKAYISAKEMYLTILEVAINSVEYRPRTIYIDSSADSESPDCSRGKLTKPAADVHLTETRRAGRKNRFQTHSWPCRVPYGRIAARSVQAGGAELTPPPSMLGALTTSDAYATRHGHGQSHAIHRNRTRGDARTVSGVPPCGLRRVAGSGQTGSSGNANAARPRRHSYPKVTRCQDIRIEFQRIAASRPP
uniref:Uncharacterized protein n=1 Tax=Mycena chlorophos TaxID=658473 RepID=A0ABQ0LPA4_MYCCL|nr:predicted protein [Mycena chlorophos]